MGTSRITLRTIDYHKYRSLVIEKNGVGDELQGRCDRDVTSLCDAVRRLYVRYDRFLDDDDGSGDDDICGRSGTSRDGRDLARFAEICGWYKLILEYKRMRSVDVRLRSCWWEGKNGEKGSATATAAGRLRSSSLWQTLVDKTVSWLSQYGAECWRNLSSTDSDVSQRLDGPGVVVFAHRDRPCFRLVARAANVFSWCSGALRDAFEGSNPDPFSALLVTSVAQNWDFYFVPVLPTDGDSLLRVLENDTILQHDSIWPYGLNFRLNVTSSLELAQLRTSCRRHRWPTARDFDLDSDDVTQVQGRLSRRLRFGINGTLDEVLTGRKDDDIFLQSLPDSPTSASAMLTFADIVATSTVKTWNDCDKCGRCRRSKLDDSESSSDGSTVTATTVRTVVTKPTVRESDDDRPATQSSGSPPAEMKVKSSAPHRSASRPASARVLQLTTTANQRSRSVSQSRPQRPKTASSSVPAETRNVKTRSSHMNRQLQSQKH